MMDDYSSMDHVLILIIVVRIREGRKHEMMVERRGMMVELRET